MVNAGNELRKEQRDLKFLLVAYGLAVVFTIGDFVDLLWRGQVAHKLAYAIGDAGNAGMILLSRVEPAAAGFLVAGVVIKWLAIIGGFTALALVIGQALRGQFFTAKNSTYFTVTISAFVMYLCGIFVQNMGANYVAAQFEIADWWEFRLGGQEVAIVYGVFVTLFFFRLVTRKGIQMQEDQEGLV
ncbi:hypothetical protein CMUST_13785 [Corynebacterium mustelae]|uniref:DUF2975 domain-containing protein n=1 Tax=Corynebacterium mustelae TaxID=571915 RepID=A0A0G3H0W1_9CORY|nr:hypothetical protein [Corynebacterium mustelae]AKK07051.1 hypothetical protein CMUST_13785 [Corynebacterium mustelae]